MFETVAIIVSGLFVAGVVVWAVCTLVSVARETREDDEKFRWRIELIKLLYERGKQ